MADQVDTRSFASLWYWIMIALFWAGMTRQVLGVPHDLAWRARTDPAAAADVAHLARIHAERYVYYWRRGALVQVGLAMFLVTGLAVLGFGFRFEFAQAVLMFLLPMLVIAGLNLRASVMVLHEDIDLSALMLHLRIYIQVIGFVSIFVTVTYGILHNILAGFYG